jgi:hypothetical protein
MDCRWTKQTWFEASGHGQHESYLAKAIQKNLLSAQDRAFMADRSYDVPDLLNGRWEQEDAERIQSIFNDWNCKLGWKEFGF